MESDINNKFPKVYISFQLSEEVNRLLTESCKRSGRKKIPEASIRLEDHLLRYRSISELEHTVLNNLEAMEAEDVCTTNSKKTK